MLGPKVCMLSFDNTHRSKHGFVDTLQCVNKTMHCIVVEFKFEQKPFISVSLLSHDDQRYRENMQNSLKSESQIWEDGSGNEFKTKIHKKNTKNWYTIDALGAIFAIFTIVVQ